VCPAGTYLRDKKECVSCEKGKYNAKDGQESCTDCPDGKTNSPAGLDCIDQRQLPVYHYV